MGNWLQLDGAKFQRVCDESKAVIRFSMQNLTHNIYSVRRFMIFTERRATKKQKVKVSIVATELCAEKYRHSAQEYAISDEHICAGGEHEYDTCAGKYRNFERNIGLWVVNCGWLGLTFRFRFRRLCWRSTDDIGQFNWPLDFDWADIAWTSDLRIYWHTSDLHACRCAH